MLKVETDRLVERALTAEIVNLTMITPPHGLTEQSSSRALPLTGVTYNVKLGDPLFTRPHDFLEPGIIAAVCPDTVTGSGECPDVTRMCCPGNKVKIINSETHGLEGMVLSTDFGLSNAIIIDFPERVYQRVGSGKRIWIRSRGPGAWLTDYPTIRLMNIDPDILPKLEIQHAGKNRLMFPVCYFVPVNFFSPLRDDASSPHLLCRFNGNDQKNIDALGIENLRFGDFIAINDLDLSGGFNKKKGAVTIAIALLSPVRPWGIAFGAVAVFTCTAGKIVPVINPGSNLGRFLSLGRYRKSF